MARRTRRLARLRSAGRAHCGHGSEIPRRDAPGGLLLSSARRGRGERRVPAAPAVSCALGSGRTHTSNNEYTGIARRSRTQWFYDLFRALPGDRALLPPSSADMFLSKPGRADLNSANLTPASGRQDHTTSPYAATSFVSPPFDRSQIFRPALQPRCSPDAAASTAFHPASVTIAIRPLWWGRIRRVLEVIWGCWKRKYFCKWDSTQVSTNRPTGKSLDASERLSRVPDAVQRPSRCSVEPGPTRGDTELYNGPRINSAPP